MISHFQANLETVSIHKVGNKLAEEYFSLSDAPYTIEDPKLNKLLITYFLSPFEKVNEIYRLFHPNGELKLNEVYHFVTEIFETPETFHEQSQQLAKHLYEQCNHAKIKSGEVYIARFTDLQIEGELLEAIGIFKSENKEAYLKVAPEDGNFSISYEQEAINLHKLDKGCLIFKTEKEAGYKVAVVDQTSRSGEAVYWKDDFLMLKTRNDNYSHTSQILGVYKNFVTQKLDEEYDITKAEKIDLLNKSLNYFKEKEQFDLEEFGQEVIGNAAGFESFKSYKQNFEEEFEVEIAEKFDISAPAVKKQSRNYKSVLKLDRNFHIYIHGNKDLIEKGYDDDKHMSYYKVYFKEEE